MTSPTLVTGCTGFVGRHVVAELERRGIPVRAVVRTGGRPIGQFESVVETPDLFAESAEWWATACRGVDTVVHLAWYAEPGKYLTSPLNLACLTGTCALAAGAIAAGIRRFIGIGTCFEYDVSRCLLDTSTPLLPTTPYAAAKASTFLTLSQILPGAGISFAWCRLFYLYGEGEDSRRLIPYVRSRIAANLPVELTSGNQIRDYLDVAEAARQIVDIASGALAGAVNICSGQPITVREFVGRIADESGGRHLLQFGARPNNLVDPPCVVGVPTLPFSP